MHLAYEVSSIVKYRFIWQLILKIIDTIVFAEAQSATWT